MAFNREKALTAAAKFVSKGQHDRAAKEYVAIIEADPNDTRSWLLLAEALTNAGDKPGAIERYLHVAEGYAASTEAQKAIAVYRKVLALDPNRLDIQTRIAALYKDLGRTADAVAAYEFVAQAYFQAGQIPEGLEGFRMVAELEPAAVGKRLRLAELYSREGMVAQAVEHFRLAADRLLADRRTDDYIRVAERLIYHKEDDLPVLRSLAQIYLKQGENRRALVKLNALLRAAPADAEGLELLGETFVAIGKVDKAISVVMELAREQRKGGRKNKETAARVLRKALAWNPENAEEIRKIAAEIETEVAALPPEPEPGESKPKEEGMDLDVDVVEDEAAANNDVDIDVDIDEEEDERQVEEVPSRPFAPVDANVAPSVVEDGEESVGDVEKILLEARVYVKYKMFEHALGHLDAVFVRDANHVAALELQAQILMELGRNADAADSFVRLAQLVSSNDLKQARAHLEQAQKLVPDHTKADMVLAALDNGDIGGGGETAPLVSGMQSSIHGDPASEPAKPESETAGTADEPSGTSDRKPDDATVVTSEPSDAPSPGSSEVAAAGEPARTSTDAAQANDEPRASGTNTSTPSEPSEPTATTEASSSKSTDVASATSDTEVTSPASSPTSAGAANATTPPADTEVTGATTSPTDAEVASAAPSPTEATDSAKPPTGTEATSSATGTESPSSATSPTDTAITSAATSPTGAEPSSATPSTGTEVASATPSPTGTEVAGSDAATPPAGTDVSSAPSNTLTEGSAARRLTALTEGSGARKLPTERTPLPISPLGKTFGEKTPLPARFGEGTPLPVFKPPPSDAAARAASEADGDSATPAAAPATTTAEDNIPVGRPRPGVRGRKPPPATLTPDQSSPEIEELDSGVIEELDADEVAEMVEVIETPRPAPPRKGPPSRPKPPAKRPPPPRPGPPPPRNEDSKVAAAPEDSKAEPVPEDSKAVAAPEDSKAEPVPEDSKAVAAPEDSKSEPVPEDSKPEPVPEDSKAAAASEDNKIAPVPEDSKSTAAPESDRTQSVPEDNKPPPISEEGKTETASGDNKAPPVSENSGTATPLEGNTTQAAEEDGKPAPVPEDSKAPVPEDSKAPVPEDSKAPVPEDSKAPVPEDRKPDTSADSSTQPVPADPGTSPADAQPVSADREPAASSTDPTTQPVSTDLKPDAPDSKSQPLANDSDARLAPEAAQISADVTPAGEHAETDAPVPTVLVNPQADAPISADKPNEPAPAKLAAIAPESSPALNVTRDPNPGDTAMMAIDAVLAPEPESVDITDELEELRFFISGRFEDDAQFAYLDLQRRFPGHPGLVEFADRFATGAKLDSAAAPVMLDDPRPASVPSRGASPARVAVLDDDDEDTFLASIFDEPVTRTPGKSKPRRAVASLDDAADPQTFFDLGTAYREMGLEDDALAQFDLAAKDPRWTARARIMSASMRVARGEHVQAIDDLNLAIDFATDVDQRSEAGYELGVLYQNMGDKEQAIEALSAVAAGYRDRDDRLKTLEA